MHVFISEYLCSGAAGDLLNQSLAVEGRAMWQAALHDVAQIPGCKVVTTVDARVAPPDTDRIDVYRAETAEHERQLFRKLAAECDLAWVIAPESGGILLQRRREVLNAGGEWLGCSAEAIGLCTDKLRLSAHLQSQGIPTIETYSWSNPGWVPTSLFPVVVKPRDGAGSTDTWRLADQHALEEWSRRHHRTTEMILQPYQAGRTLSAGALVFQNQDGVERVEVFPAGDQHLSQEGRFRYLGGRIPTGGAVQPRVEQLLIAACKSIPGLSGYVGFDLILPEGPDAEPVIVEINPRLTTAWIGYRNLAAENLAARLLFPDRFSGPISWDAATVTFRANGEAERSDRPAVVSGKRQSDDDASIAKV